MVVDSTRTEEAPAVPKVTAAGLEDDHRFTASDLTAGNEGLFRRAQIHETSWGAPHFIAI